ncbi:MAG: hypothetical protein KDD51_07495, partial [Bdellovibrionales bacterium]|nr:hypothetical protein [Bdellovibrionales bacterium]
GSNRGLRNSRAISVLLAVGTALWGADQWAHRPENADKPVAQYVQAAEQETGAVISGLVGVCQRTYDSMR